MKIGDNNFNEAVQIISTFTSKTTVSFNVPINGNYSSVYAILLQDACPGLIGKLFEAGFHIGICDKGAYIDKF